MRSRHAVTSSVGDTLFARDQFSGLGEREPRQVGGRGRPLRGGQPQRTSGATAAPTREAAEGAAGERGHGAHLTPGRARGSRDQRASVARSRRRLGLESRVLWNPCWIRRCGDCGVEGGSGLGLPIALDQRLGQEQQRDHAVWLVGERRAQVLFRLLEIAAEESWHLVVPAAERPVGRSIEKGGIESTGGLERFADRRAVLDALAQTVRIGQRAHVCGHPEVSVRGAGARRRRRPAGRDALLEDALLLVRRRWTVGAQPVAHAGELRRRLEVGRIGGEAIGPDPLGGSRALGPFAIAIQRVGIVGRCLRVQGRRSCAQGNDRPQGMIRRCRI